MARIVFMSLLVHQPSNREERRAAMQTIDTLETLDINSLSLVTGGEGNGPGPNPAPANPGINEETYRYAGGELGRAGGEILGSETAAKHLQTAGQTIGTGLHRAGTWLGNQFARLTGN